MLEIIRQAAATAGELPVNQHIPLPREVAPDQVHEVLGRHVLADGFKLVYDTRASIGSWVVDAQSGEKYLDLYTFSASAPLGSNE
jgi:4-aminobutyrate aminotransferase-like enzyme